jgi:hypothetical protein
MPHEPRNVPPGPAGVQEFDELQRGHEEPVTLETMEPALPAYGERAQREIPIPHPGERPGAISINEDLEPPNEEPEHSG